METVGGNVLYFTVLNIAVWFACLL